MTCDDCPGGSSWEDRALAAEAEVERVAAFLAETPAMGWQSAALVWRDRAEEAEAQLAKILEGGDHRGAVLSLQHQRDRLAAERDALRDIAEDAVAYIDTFKHTRPDRGKVASEFGERLREAT